MVRQPTAAIAKTRMWVNKRWGCDECAASRRPGKQNRQEKEPAGRFRNKPAGW
jgi:hypothetical protein